MITNDQERRIQDAHARGLTDAQVAHEAGVSIATVKRVRARLGLPTRCATALRGQAGEAFVAREATARGLPVQWRAHVGDRHDLTVAGRRVDVKTARQMPDGSWRFRLTRTRQSYYNTYRYEKDYAADCDVLALVCESRDGSPPQVYFLESTAAPTSVRVRAGVIGDGLHTWEQVFVPAGGALAA